MRLGDRRVRGSATVAVALGASIVAVACGTTQRTPQSPGPHAASGRASACDARGTTVLARAAGIGVASLTRSPFTEADGAASCRFTARRPLAGRLDVVVELDSQPQAYYRLERGTVEYAQNVIWDHEGERAYPLDIPHLGLDADWFPAESELETTDGVRLITIVVAAFPAGERARERMATGLAKVYLRNAR